MSCHDKSSDIERLEIGSYWLPEQLLKRGSFGDSRLKKKEKTGYFDGTNCTKTALQRLILLCFGVALSLHHLTQYNWFESEIERADVDSGFFSWGDGGSPHPAKILPIPPSDTCPCFWTKACPPPQPRFVPENLKNLNTFLCQIWLILSSKVP